jgi:hypothetical protein
LTYRGDILFSKSIEIGLNLVSKPFSIKTGKIYNLKTIAR